MQKTIKGLLFDKDGTLFDFHATWGVWCGGFISDLAKDDSTIGVKLAEVLGFDLQTSRFRPDSSVIAGGMDVVIHSIHSVLGDWEMQALVEHVVQTTSAAPQSPTVALLPLLTRFREAGFKIGVATNDGEVPARAHLDTAGILQQFDYISGFDSGHGSKPEPGMLLGFCQETGLEPHQVAMIGDSTHDLRAGRAAGMVNVAVLTGLASHDDLAPLADVVLGDIGHIPGWLGLE